MSTSVKVRSRVRPQWLVFAAALVVLAGVLVAWGMQQATARVQVVQLVREVASGQPFQSDDLGTVGIAYDTQVEGLVPAESLDRLVGRVAAADLQPGQLVQSGMWRDQAALRSGERSVGAVLRAGRMPAGLVAGDVAVAARMLDSTAAIAADTTSAGVGSSGTESAVVAGVAPVLVRLVDVQTTAEGNQLVTLAVPEAAAVQVAQWAATEQLVLVGGAS
ncbi:MAG: hypothetical protein RI900_1658 [Actinomycetota bacterium]|jgi:hypothetical protein